MKYMASESSYKQTLRFESDSLEQCLKTLAKWIEEGGIYNKMTLHEQLGESGWQKLSFKVMVILK